MTKVDIVHALSAAGVGTSADIQMVAGMHYHAVPTFAPWWESVYSLQAGLESLRPSHNQASINDHSQTTHSKWA